MMRIKNRLDKLEGLQQPAEPTAGIPSTRAHEALLEAIVRGSHPEVSETARMLVEKARQAPHVPVKLAQIILEAHDASDRGLTLARHYLEAHREA